MIDALNTMLQLAIIGLLIFGFVFGLFRHVKRPSAKYSSVLLSFYTLNRDIVPLVAGEVADGISYASMLITPKNNPRRAVTGYFIYLPFTSNIRLLAIATKSDIQINPSMGDSLMKPVHLEGNFSDYFSLYANVGDEQQSRYVLDPDAMTHAIDFLSSYDWEIINNELIIISKYAIIHDQVEEFIRKIEPSIKISSSKAESLIKPEYKKPFGFKQLKKPIKSIFKCPICKKMTKPTGDTHTCPRGHGQIMTGGALAKMQKNNQLVTPKDTSEILRCPNCKHAMIKVNYGTGKVTIDSCINCPYRWLDSGELLVN